MVATEEPQEIDAAFNERCVVLLTDWDTGRLTAQELLQQLAQLADEANASGRAANQGRVEHLLGYVHHYLGNYAISSNHYEKARRFYTRAGNRHRVAVIHMNQGENYRLRGEYNRALSLYRSALEIVETLGDLPTVSYALTNQGLVLIRIKEYEQARVCLQKAYDLSLEWHGKVYTDNVENAHSIRCEIFLGLAEIAMHEGRLDDAWDAGKQSLLNAEIAQEPRSVGLAYRVLGNLRSSGVIPTGDDLPASADEYYQRALDAFRQLQAQGEIGLTIFAQASSMAARGDRHQATRLYREAIIIFTRLGMTYDAARAADAQMKLV